MVSNKGAILHTPQTNTLSKSESYREGKVGTLGKLFGKKKTKKSQGASKDSKVISPPPPPSRVDSLSASSSASVDMSDGSVVYSPAEFLPVARASIDSTSSSSSKSCHKKRHAPAPPTLKVLPQEHLYKDGIPESPMSEKSFRSFSSSSSLGTPPILPHKSLYNSLPVGSEFVKRGSASSLLDFSPHKRDPTIQSTSLESSRLQYSSPSSTCHILAERGIIYASIEDLSTVAEAVKELPLPPGAPPPKPKRLSLSPDVLEEMLDEIEADPKISLSLVDEGNEHADEEIVASKQEPVAIASSQQASDLKDTTSDNSKEDAYLEKQSAAQEEELKQLYLFDMLAPHLQTNDSQEMETIVDTKVEVKQTIRDPDSVRAQGSGSKDHVEALCPPPARPEDYSSEPIKQQTASPFSKYYTHTESEHTPTFEDSVKPYVSELGLALPIQNYENENEDGVEKTRESSTTISISHDTETSANLQTLPSGSKHVPTVPTDFSTCKEVPMIPDYSAVRQMAKEAIHSNHERASEIKAILKRSMARMMGVELPVESVSINVSVADDVRNDNETLVNETISLSVGAETENQKIDGSIDMEEEPQNVVEKTDSSSVTDTTSKNLKEEVESPSEDVNSNKVSSGMGTKDETCIRSDTDTEDKAFTTPIVTTPCEKKESIKAGTRVKTSLLDDAAYKVSETKLESTLLTRSSSFEKKKTNDFQRLSNLSRSKSFGAEEWKSKISSHQTDEKQHTATFDFARADPKDELKKLASLSVVRAAREKFGSTLSNNDSPKKRPIHSEKLAFSQKSSQSLTTRNAEEKENFEFVEAQKSLKKCPIPDKEPIISQNNTTVKAPLSTKESPIEVPQHNEPTKIITSSVHRVATSQVSPEKSSTQILSHKVADQAPSSLSFAGVGRVMYQSKAMTWKKSTERVQQKEEVPVRKNYTDDSSSIVSTVSSWKEKRTKRKSLVDNEYNTGVEEKGINRENIVVKSELTISPGKDDGVSETVVVKEGYDKNVQDMEAEMKSENVERRVEPEMHQVQVKVEAQSAQIQPECKESINTQQQLSTKEDNSSELEPIVVEDTTITTESATTATTLQEENTSIYMNEEKPHTAIKVDEETHIKRHREVRERTKSILAKMKATTAFQNPTKSAPAFSDDTSVQRRDSKVAAQIRDRRRNAKSTPNIDKDWEMFDEIRSDAVLSPEAHVGVTQEMLPQNVDEKNRVNSDKQIKHSPSSQLRVTRKIKRKSYVRRSVGADLDRQSESSSEGLSEDEPPRRQHLSGRLDSGFSDMASHSELDRRVLPHKNHPRKTGGKAKQSSPRSSPIMPPKFGEYPTSNLVSEAPSEKFPISSDPSELQRIIFQQQEEMRLLRQQMQASQIQANQIQATQMQTSQMQATSLSEGIQSPAVSLGQMNVANPHVPTMPYMYSTPNMMMVPQRGMMQQPMYYVPQGMQVPQGLQTPTVQMPGVLPISNYSPYAPSHVPFPVQGMLPMQTQMPMGLPFQQGSVTQYPTSHFTTLTAAGGSIVEAPRTVEQKHSE